MFFFKKKKKKKKKKTLKWLEGGNHRIAADSMASLHRNNTGNSNNTGATTIKPSPWAHLKLPPAPNSLKNKK